VPVFHLAILAALQGLTEALPVSRSGHEAVARLWLDGSAPLTAALAAILHLGTALGLAVVARRRLLAALGEGLRAVTRPTRLRDSPAVHDAVLLAVGTAVSLTVDALVSPRVERWNDSPTATGVGLCVTGLALAGAALAPRPARSVDALPVAPWLAGVVAGVALGVASFPGGSRVGAALTLLLWMGVKPGRAVDLAFLLTVPTLIVAFARRAPGGGDLEAGTVALGLVLAVVGAAVGCELLRSLAERRRVGVLALWTIPLGLATIAYAHALPLPA
jgi:undecaprenyl-diphosphatase